MRNLSAWRKRGGRGHDGTICATPNYEAGKGATIKMERAGGGRPKAREIFKGVLVRRFSRGARLQFALGALAWRARRPFLPPIRVPTSGQFSRKT